jgi:hypothetical protein
MPGFVFRLHRFLPLLCLVLLGGSGAAFAQTGPFFDIQGDGGAAGADDSTIGSMSPLSAPQLVISPSSADWTDDPTVWKNFSVTNSGGLTTSAISVSVGGGGYDIQTNCSALAGGQSCAVALKPNGRGPAIDTLVATAQFGGTGQAGLRASFGSSCLALLNAGVTQSGAYFLSSSGGGIYKAWCDMTTDGGGWTLVMRLDSSSSDLAYAATQWTSQALLRETDVQPAVDPGLPDAKFQSYNEVTGSVLRVEFVRPGTGIDGFKMEYSGLANRTALTLFSGGRIQLAGTLQQGCNGARLTGAPGYSSSLMRFGTGRQFFGINLDQGFASGSNQDRGRMRFGYASNDEDWTAAYGRLGIGMHTWWSLGSPQHYYNSLRVASQGTDCASCQGCYGSASNLGGGRSSANMWVR